MIATHNSATGEKGRGFLSWLLTPFARCQSKTIREQYEAGCRYFDIRVRLDNRYGFVVAHGPWVCKRCAWDILNEINNFDEPCYVDITYEGESSYDWWYSMHEEFKKNHPRIKIARMSIKKPSWVTVLQNIDAPYFENKYIGLSKEHWQHWIPIPWLWDFIYFRNHDFSNDIFTFTDFL